MPDLVNVSINLTLPNLPEGWEGTPQDFLAWLSENSIFNASGALLTGQIGSTGDVDPTQNVGLYLIDGVVKRWNGTKYVPITTVPIGTVLDWPTGLQSPPDFHLFCEGQLLEIVTYPELAAVYGKTWNRPTDDTDHFRLPDFRGRMAVGAADAAGDNNPNRVDGVGNGSISLRAPGTYFGAEWATYNVPTPTGAPVPRYSFTLLGSRSTKTADGGPFAINKSTFTGIMNPSVGVRKIVRYI